MSQDIATKDMTGTAYDDAVASLGTPSTEESFTLEPGAKEFRVELLNFYDAARLKSDPPQIREVTWSVAEGQNLTLWFTQDDGEWRVLHQLNWRAGDEF